MKTNVEKVGSLNRKLSVEIPAEVVRTAFNRVFTSIQRDVTLKGFRKGKAPLNTVKSLYGDRVTQDVAQELIQMHYPKALSDLKLEPISYPEFEFEDPTEAKDFSFTATFDIRPEVNLKKYEGLEVEKEKINFDESKVTQVLENIRAARATLVDVTDARPAALSDVAVVDFEGFVDGKPLDNGSGTNHNLDLGAKQFIDGFEEGIVGMKVGESKTLSLKFPDPYHAAELAGKAVEFKTKLVGLKRKELPEMNDEFLKSLGGPSDLEALKQTIRDDLQQSETKRVEDGFKDRLLKKLVKENPVEVPASLAKEQKETLVQDFKKRMTEQGMSDADYESYVKQWDADFSQTAAEMIQSSFLIDAIAKKEDLGCKKEDLDKKFAEYTAQTGIEETRIREFYSKPEQMSRLTYMITEEKVVALLTAKAKVKEVTADQLKDAKN